ncbi:uncharacterized protein LOC110682000 isoform X2 [Chenopodium quinoa]|nr:uncharacterized protein LOC110682000 isoform X2 [Chenopodium quinoa]
MDIGDYWGKRGIEHLKYNLYDFLKEEGKSVPKDRETRYTSFTKDFEPRPNPASGWHGKDDIETIYTSLAKDFKPRPNPAFWWHGKDAIETKYTSFGKFFEPKPNPTMEGNPKVI